MSPREILIVDVWGYETGEDDITVFICCCFPVNDILSNSDKGIPSFTES